MQSINSIISHQEDLNDFDITPFEAALQKKQDLSVSKEEALNLLHQLAAFEEGRFLLQNKGLNGFMTSHIILHGPKKQNMLPLQSFIINDTPVVKATRERFWIFQKVLQKNLASKQSIASIPCGLMDDLLLLDTEPFENIHLTGIDLDQESLDLAKENALYHQKYNTHFFKKDAWHLDEINTYDMIASNGLNIYEKDDQRVIALYKQFHTALKSEGILVTSFLTPPPLISSESTWKNYNVADALKQKILFGEIIGVGWQSFRTENQTRDHLQQASFRIAEIHYDSQGMFPTIVAEKC